MARMKFNTRGHRVKLGCGMYYYSACGKYAVYKSHQYGGVALPVRWLAIYMPTKKIIGRHLKRLPAEKTCNAHAAKAVAR